MAGRFVPSYFIINSPTVTTVLNKYSDLSQAKTPTYALYPEGTGRQSEWKISQVGFSASICCFHLPAWESHEM
jgi:hypothetical protein